MRFEGNETIKLPSGSDIQYFEPIYSIRMQTEDLNADVLKSDRAPMDADGFLGKVRIGGSLRQTDLFSFLPVSGSTLLSLDR